MLRLNRMTDYAILVLGVLQAHDGEVLSSAQIACYANLAQTTVAKLIRQLVSGGLVKTVRGIRGGCHLGRPADEVTIVDVIEVMEGPIEFTACVDGVNDPCAVQNSCFMSGNWNRVNEALKKALSEITLAELYDPAEIFPPAMSQRVGT